jgi:sensor domain CHASE-containing protein
MTDRAVSSTLNYVLSLGIMAVLVTGLLSAGGGFVEDRQEEVIRSELEVIGQQVASDVQRADRLVTAGDDNREVTLAQSLPERISGTGYRISLETTPETELVLISNDPEISVSVRVQTTTDLAPSNAGGGTVVVTYTSSEKLEVTND